MIKRNILTFTELTLQEIKNEVYQCDILECVFNEFGFSLEKIYKSILTEEGFGPES